jgi:hypothetical protein
MKPVAEHAAAAAAVSFSVSSASSVVESYSRFYRARIVVSFFATPGATARYAPALNTI